MPAVRNKGLTFVDVVSYNLCSTHTRRSYGARTTAAADVDYQSSDEQLRVVQNIS